MHGLMERVVVGITALCVASGLAAQGTSEPAKARKVPDPARFEKQISEFEAADRATTPPAGAIVCVGSSSMRGWHKTLAADLAPLTVLPRGFGGSHMSDAIHYADRVVIAYRPRAVVVYEGDNDINSGLPAEEYRDNVAKFVDKVRGALPEVRIYVLSIKPSPSRWAKWPEMKKANELVREYCNGKDFLAYIDVATPMLDESGQPKADIFLKDRLHMNDAGYRIWTEAVKPVLMKAEAQYEKK